MTSRAKSRLLTDKETDNLSQIIQNFFLKSAQIIIGFRSLTTTPTLSQSNISLNYLDENYTNNIDNVLKDKSQSPSNSETNNNKSNKNKNKINKWFNIGSCDVDGLKNDMILWKNKDITSLPPLVIETVLDLRGLDSSQTLLIDGDIINTHKKSEIVLERWLIQLDLNKYDNDNIELPGIYKKLIVMFRCLYMLVRLLPAYKLRSSILQSKLKSANSIKVNTKLLNGSRTILSKGRFGLSKPLISEKANKEIVESKDLVPILTPIGSLRLSVSYRQNCNFQLNDTEEILSSQFMLATKSSPQKYHVHQDIKTSSLNTSNDELDEPQSNHIASSPMEHNKYRFSSASISSQNSRRRSSARSTSIFKVGSLASSSPPPFQPQAHRPSSASPHTHISSGSFSPSKPIPVTLQRNNSNASILRYGKDPLHSVGSNANYAISGSGSGDSANGIVARRNTDDSVNQQIAVVMSTSGKFASSFGSRFKAGSSRHNSLDGQLVNTPTNPILQNFKARNRVFSSSFSDLEPTNSMYLDDDLDNFMKMLDSKPNLRISSISSGIYDDSLNNFKNIQKNNEEFFHGIDSPLKQSFTDSSSFPQPPPVSSQNDNRQSAPMMKLLLQHQQRYSETASLSRSRSCSGSGSGSGSGPSVSVSSYKREDSLSPTNPIAYNKNVDRRSRGNSMSYSPSSRSILKATATSGTIVTPAVTHGRGISVSSGEVSLKEMLRRGSQCSSNYSSVSQPMELSQTSNSNNIRSGSITKTKTTLRTLSYGGNNTPGSHLRQALINASRRNSSISSSAASSKDENSSSSIDTELLKLRSFSEKVFESDDEDDDHHLRADDNNSSSIIKKYSKLKINGDPNVPLEEQKSLESHPHSQSQLQLQSLSQPQSELQLQPQSQVQSRTQYSGNNLHRYGSSGPVVSTAAIHINGNLGTSSGRNEDDEEELLFAMSDMTLAKNNVDF